MLHAIEDDRAHRNLSGIRLSPRFRGDDAGQQVVIAVGNAAVEEWCRWEGDGRQGLRAGDAVGGQTVFALEIANRRFGFAAVDSVHRAGVVPQSFRRC